MNTVLEKEPQPSVQAERPYVSPEVNIYETPEAYTIEAEMPGVTRAGIEVTVEGNMLTFTGHRSDEPPKGTVLYRESRVADFRRVFELDPLIDASKVTAEMRQGVLVLTLPKAERVKPRRIEIK
jgi:HSP20 family protein